MMGQLMSKEVLYDPLNEMAQAVRWKSSALRNTEHS